MYRFRTGNNGELVLQVEEDSATYDSATGRKLPPTWRDATVADVPTGNPFSGKPVGSGFTFGGGGGGGILRSGSQIWVSGD